MASARELRLTGRAARFAQLLHDFGHLDFDDLNKLLLAVGDLTDGESQVVDIAELRRAAAMWLFPEGGAAEEGQPVLLDDWPILFS